MGFVPRWPSHPRYAEHYGVRLSPEYVRLYFLIQERQYFDAYQAMADQGALALEVLVYAPHRNNQSLVSADAVTAYAQAINVSNGELTESMLWALLLHTELLPRYDVTDLPDALTRFVQDYGNDLEVMFGVFADALADGYEPELIKAGNTERILNGWKRFKSIKPLLKSIGYHKFVPLALSFIEPETLEYFAQNSGYNLTP